MNLPEISGILGVVDSLVIAILLPLLTLLGVQKYFIEPRYEARNSRRKYATALYIACEELRLHLSNTNDLLDSKDPSKVKATADAMKKIPNNDFKGNLEWFTKEGYYTTITAYKIAVVSAWLKIYQNALLFSSYHENQAFLNDLYTKSQNLKLAFSEETCLWDYYFDAIGEMLIEDNTTVASVMNFAKFCGRYVHDSDFRLFFEQVHMYIWLLGNKEPKYLDTIPEIKRRLKDIVTFLKKKDLLSGFKVERSKAAMDALDKARKSGWRERETS